MVREAELIELAFVARRHRREKPKRRTRNCRNPRDVFFVHLAAVPHFPIAMSRLQGTTGGWSNSTLSCSLIGASTLPDNASTREPWLVRPVQLRVQALPVDTDQQIRH